MRQTEEKDIPLILSQCENQSSKNNVTEEVIHSIISRRISHVATTTPRAVYSRVLEQISKVASTGGHFRRSGSWLPSGRLVVRALGIQAGCLLGGDAEQGLAVELVAGQDGQPAGRLGADGGVFLAVWGAHGGVEDRSGAGFGGGSLVDLDQQEPVEKQVHLGVGDRPFAEQRALRQAVLAVISQHQDRVGQGSLRRAPDGGDRHRLAAASPRAVLECGLVDPVLVPDHGGLVGELPGAVVEVVAGERARGGDLGLRRPVAAEGQREGGPGDRGGQPPKRRVRHGPGHRRAGVAACGLGETYPVPVDLRRRGEVGQGHAGECQPTRP